MKIYPVIASLILLIAGGNLLFCQQITHLSLYSYDQIVLNPAYTNTSERKSASIHHRSQWTGFKGAPNTQYISFDGIGKSKASHGFGGFLFNDVAGPVRNTGLNMTYSYKLKLDRNFTMAMGIGASISQFVVNGNKIELTDEVDQLINQSAASYSHKPNFSTGIYIYDKMTYVGLSVLQLTQPRMKLFEDIHSPAIMRMKRHFYLTGGRIIEIERDYSITPSVLITYVDGNPVQFTLSGFFSIKEMAQFGLGFRSNDAMILSFSIQKWKEFNINYSYDLQLFRMFNYSGGSHEIMFVYLFDEL